MSKVLRRPMFRGGRVDSRGTGITSGLEDSGYADGGRIGYADGPDMYGVQYEPSSDVSSQQQKYYDFLRDFGGGEYLEPGATTDIYGNYISGLKEKTKPAGPLEFIGSVLNPFKKTYGGVSRFGEQKNLEYATSDIGKQEIMSDIERKRKQQAQMILNNPRLAPNKVDLARQILGDQGVKSEITGLEPQILPQKSIKDEILEEAALYREALGYDESKSQAIFDALGAAAPAAFQGKNLREAAPKIFEAINKSEAFEKPKNIKQASGQLAIQRKMLRDKAIAEEKTRLAVLSAKNQESLLDKLKIPGSFIAGPLPQGAEKNLNLLRAGGIYELSGEYFYAVSDAKGKITGLQKI